jgi:kynurenine formamidase
MPDRRDTLPPLDRRALLAALAVAAPATALARPVSPEPARVRLHGRPITMVDCTHKLTKAFDFTPGTQRIGFEPLRGSGEDAGMLLNRVQLVEHTGTHIDAPRHFDPAGKSLGEIPLMDLVVPLARIDLRRKLAQSRNATVDLADIRAWEAEHGRLPDNCCVAMWSGWSPLEELARMPSLPPAQRYASPGFSVEAVRFLAAERRVRGIAVDTMSLDTGGSAPHYPAHGEWLRSGRWGVEGLTNLERIPEAGALLIVAAAPLEGATGLPVRAIALY